jgi:hypothetical protein
MTTGTLQSLPKPRIIGVDIARGLAPLFGALPLPVLSEDYTSGGDSGDRGKAPRTAHRPLQRLSYRRRQKSETC